MLTVTVMCLGVLIVPAFVVRVSLALIMPSVRVTVLTTSVVRATGTVTLGKGCANGQKQRENQGQ